MKSIGNVIEVGFSQHIFNYGMRSFTPGYEIMHPNKKVYSQKKKFLFLAFFKNIS
jgi:hypothetical protein